MPLSRRDREREFKKELIAEAAQRLFTRSSYESVTVEDIAKEAEFGKGTIYQYFNSKEEILSFVLCRSIEGICDNLQKQCLNASNPQLALDRMITLLYKFYLDYTGLFFPLLLKRRDGTISPGCWEALRDKYEQKTRLTARVLEQVVSREVLDSIDSLRLARIMGNIIKGFCLGSMERMDLDQEKNLALIKLVLSRGITK